MNSIRIRVRVTPRSRKDQISGVMQDGRLKIRLAAPPLDGKANRSLVNLMEKTLDLPKGSVSISSGLHNRDKVLKIEGMSSSEYQCFLDSIEL